VIVGEAAVACPDMSTATAARSKTNAWAFMHGVGGGCRPIRDTFDAAGPQGSSRSFDATGPQGSNRSDSAFRFFLAHESALLSTWTCGPLRGLGATVPLSDELTCTGILHFYFPNKLQF